MKSKKCSTSQPQFGIRSTKDRIKGGNAPSMDGTNKKKKY